MMVLTGAQVRGLLPVADAVGLMRTALLAYSTGQAEQPLRHMIRAPGGPILAVMPAHVTAAPDDPTAGFGLKAVAIDPRNSAHGLPTHVGFVVVFDPATSMPCALMSGAAVTAIRTAAASAAATDALARQDVHVLALLGSGVQARTHLAAMLAVREPAEIRVWNHREGGAHTFARWAGETLGRSVSVHPTVAGAVAGADLICTATAATEPVLRSGDVADGAHINAIGSSSPGARELDGDLVGRCRVFVDSLVSARAEAGDLRQAAAEGRFAFDDAVAEAGAVIAGTAAGRRSPADVTLFKSLGLAVQDVLTGFEVYRRARAAGIGTTIDLGDAP